MDRRSPSMRGEPAMRARTLGLIVLGLAGVAPLVAYGAFAVRRAERAAITEVRSGNGRLARSIARNIREYAESERGLLRSIGSSALMASTPEQAEAVLDAFALSFLHIHDLAVYRQDGARFAGAGT